MKFDYINMDFFQNGLSNIETHGRFHVESSSKGIAKKSQITPNRKYHRVQKVRATDPQSHP